MNVDFMNKIRLLIIVQ